jgi:hypothetical protein
MLRVFAVERLIGGANLRAVVEAADKRGAFIPIRSIYTTYYTRDV